MAETFEGITFTRDLLDRLSPNDCARLAAAFLMFGASKIDRATTPEAKAKTLYVHNHDLDPSCRERVIDGHLRGDCLAPAKRQRKANLRRSRG